MTENQEITYVPTDPGKMQVRTTLTLANEWGDGMSIKLLEQTENQAHTIRLLMRYGCKYVQENNLLGLGNSRNNKKD
jgi:hypothetical protein